MYNCRQNFNQLIYHLYWKSSQIWEKLPKPNLMKPEQIKVTKKIKSDLYIPMNIYSVINTHWWRGKGSLYKGALTGVSKSKSLGRNLPRIEAHLLIDYFGQRTYQKHCRKACLCRIWRNLDTNINKCILFRKSSQNVFWVQGRLNF